MGESDGMGQPITGLRRGAVGENVFLCGDPARVSRIAKSWSNVREVLNLREYRVAVGERDGVRLAAASRDYSMLQLLLSASGHSPPGWPSGPSV